MFHTGLQRSGRGQEVERSWRTECPDCQPDPVGLPCVKSTAGEQPHALKAAWVLTRLPRQGGQVRWALSAAAAGSVTTAWPMDRAAYTPGAGWSRSCTFRVSINTAQSPSSVSFSRINEAWDADQKGAS